MKSQQPKKNNKALIIVVILAIMGIVIGAYHKLALKRWE